MIILTPTEDLCMEVLGARYRLGENIWTFDSRHKPALEKLAARGLVRLMNGTVEKTCRASLTAEGKKEALDEGYIPPINAKLKKKYRK